MFSFSNGDGLQSADEGQLSIDVFREGDQLVIRSTLAGVKPEDLEIHVHGDLLTIRGKRETAHAVSEEQWFYRECYWGVFSRSIVLPYEVASDLAEASLKNGVLEIRMPIQEHGKRLSIRVEE